MYTVVHLLEDCSFVQICDAVVNLHAAQHGAWVHDDGVLVHGRRAILGQAKEVGVFAVGGEEAAIHALLLYAQHHDDVGVCDFRIKVIGHAHRPILHPKGHEGGWAYEGYFCTEGSEQIYVGAHDARVQAIADNLYLQAGKAFVAVQSKALAHRDGVEKRLRWVLVRAVARVDHRRSLAVRRNPLSQLLGRTRGRVAHDDRIGADGGQGQARILQGLALLYRGCGGRQVNDVRGHPLAGRFKGRAGAGGVFIKEGIDGPAPQGRQLLYLAAFEGLAEAIRFIHQTDNFASV